MIPINEKKGLIVLMLLALFAPALTAQESEFIPGDDRIIEKDILRRIQKELGTDIAREKSEAEAEEEKKAEAVRKAAQADPTVKTVTLSLKDQRRVSGKVVLSQSYVAITPENSVQEIQVPIEEIRSLEFTEWKARRLRVLPSPQQGAKPARTADSAANSPAEPAEVEEGSAGAAAESAAEPAATAGQTGSAGSVRIYFLPTKCRVTRADESVVEGSCQSMDWLGFSLSGQTVGSFRAYYAEERSLPEGGALELEKSLDSIEATTPVDTVTSIELGGTFRESNSGTAARTD